MKVLIVDDNEASRRLLGIYLSDYGSLATANDGIEAIKAFKDALEAGERFDLICMDYYMPQMDGMEAVKIIRQIESEHQTTLDNCVRIIMMSVVNNESLSMQACANGCDAHVILPCKKNRFIEEINDVCQRRSYTDH